MDIIKIKRKATMCKEKLIQHMFQIYLRTLILQINASTAVSNETAEGKFMFMDVQGVVNVPGRLSFINK